MSAKRYQQDVERHKKEIARLQQAALSALQLFNKEADTFSQWCDMIDISSPSMQKQFMKKNQRYQEAAERYRQKLADFQSKIALEAELLDDSQNRLLAAQERTARNHEQRLKGVSGKLAQHDQLHGVALSAIEKLQQLPEEITVLFFAADPFTDEKLRLDEEVRAIGEMIRKSKHRDSVRLESRWAVRPLDILQAINECLPRVVHFSGHGSDQDEIVFKDNAGRVKLVSKEAIVQTMAAASEDIQLVFFNTCYSSGQAEAVVQHVPAAIGMKTSIRDDAARVFSAQFYSAIGFGLSIRKAFQQAKVALMLEGIPEESTPELFVAAGLNSDELVLVQPAAPAATATA